MRVSRVVRMVGALALLGAMTIAGGPRAHAAGLPEVSIDDAVVVEGNSGTTVANYKVSLSSPSNDPVIVHVSTSDNSAKAPDDYTAVGKDVLFAPGTTTQPFSVPVHGDTDFEADEQYFVDLSSPTNATIAIGPDGSADRGKGIIRNDDSMPSVSIADVELDEGNSSTHPANFAVTLSGKSFKPVVVHAATRDGSATHSGDFIAKSADVTIPADTTGSTFAVSITGDTRYEHNETFSVDLTAPSGANAGDMLAVGTIDNDDAKPASTPKPHPTTPPVPTLTPEPQSTDDGSSGPNATFRPHATSSPSSSPRPRRTSAPVFVGGQALGPPSPSGSPSPRTNPSSSPTSPLTEVPAGATDHPTITVTHKGSASGIPGSGIMLRGAGWATCDTVYVFLENTQIAAGHPDASGSFVLDGRSIPGDAKTGLRSLTAGCSVDGSRLAVTTFQITHASSHRSAFATSLNKPSDVSWTARNLVISVGIALLLTLILAFVTELFNSTYEENHIEIRSWFGRIGKKERDPSTFERGLTFTLLIGIGGVLCALISPDAGLNWSTVALSVGMAIALVIVTVGFGTPNSVVMRRRFKERGRIASLPATVIIAALCVVGSRALHFQPGLLYGLLAGLTFKRELEDRLEGKLAAIACGGILAVSLIAWFASEPLSRAASSSSSFWVFTAEAIVGAIAFVGLETLAFVLMPLRFMVGPTIMEWSRLAWFALFTVSFGVYVLILVRPGVGYVGSSTALPVTAVLFAAVPSIGSVAFWSYFRFRPDGWVPEWVRETQEGEYADIKRA